MGKLKFLLVSTEVMKFQKQNNYSYCFPIPIPTPLQKDHCFCTGKEFVLCYFFFPEGLFGTPDPG